MLSALLVSCLASFAPQGTEEDFGAELARVRELAALGRWKTAAAELEGLLVRHERAPYVAPHAPEIVELCARCAFFSEFTEPDPASLIAGELVSYDPSSGRMALRYGDSPGDFQDFDGFLRHPVAFVGPYEVEVTGRMPREREGDAHAVPEVLVCLEPSSSHQVVFGFPRVARDGRETWLPPRLVRNAAGGSTVLAEAPETPLVLGERYRVAVTVGTTRISAAIDDRVILTAAKPRELFGRVALRCPDVERVTLSGFADPAWLRGQADLARVAAEKDFRRAWDPANRVPAWLLALVSDDAGAVETAFPVARSLTTPERATLARLAQLERERRPSEGLELLDALDAGALPRELALFYRCLFASELERRHEALAAIDRALAIAPDFVEARALRVRVLALLGEREAVLAAVDEILGAAPSGAFVWSECARSLLSIGEPLRAKAAVLEALRLGVAREALRDAEGLLVRALGGPSWERVYEYRSANYVVQSDIGRNACFEAANALEECLRFYERRLGRLAGRARGVQPPARLPVFVFSSRAGYSAYARDLFPAAPESTAGLYSPFLKQLLVWSQDEKAATLRTLRHEGLHAYLDGRVRVVPRWLDEGLAEYFESVANVRGALVDGALHVDHLRFLGDSSTPWLPLADLFALPPDAFYADVRRNYAESWAVVHWLLRAGLAEQRLFQRLLDDLGEGVSPDEVHARLLSAGDLDGRVRAHMDALLDALLDATASDGLSPGSR